MMSYFKKSLRISNSTPDYETLRKNKQFSKNTMKFNIFLIILGIFLIHNKNAHALRFQSVPITVDPNVILLNTHLENYKLQPWD